MPGLFFICFSDGVETAFTGPSKYGFYFILNVKLLDSFFSFFFGDIGWGNIIEENVYHIVPI